MYNTFEIRTKTGSVSSARGIYPTNKEIEKALITFVEASREEKKIKERKESAAEPLRNFIRAVREFFAKKGDYNKTYRVMIERDKEVIAVDVTSMDKYKVPSKQEDISAMKKELGGLYNQLFEEVLSIKVKETVANDVKKRKELTKLLVEALGEEKMKEYFEKSVSIEVKPGLSEKLPQLSQEQKDILYKYVIQTTDTVKDVSYTKEE